MSVKSYNEPYADEGLFSQYMCTQVRYLSHVQNIPKTWVESVLFA